MRRPAVLVALLLVAGGTLIAVELALGARDYGRVELAPACSAPPPQLDRNGLDRTIQRIVLGALSEAACELETTREELVLSLSPRTGSRYGTWSDEELEEALRAGLVEAVDDARDRGELGSTEARVLRELAERAPVQLILEAAERADILSALDLLDG
jgi:electron transfer flavoprotein alpha/beta subunit